MTSPAAYGRRVVQVKHWIYGMAQNGSNVDGVVTCVTHM